MERRFGAAVVGQSGGPTAAINATLAGVIEGVLASGGDTITHLYGMKNGIEGLLENRLVDLTERFSSPEERALLKQTPAAALGSCRRKLPAPDSDPEFWARLIAVFKQHDIRYFFYIGGNDSMDTVSKLSAYTAAHDYPMQIVGLPKTIDNDLAGTSHTPGFGSAAKYIAATVQEIVRDCAVYTVPAVTVVEIMGRDAGWLTASAALPRICGGGAPDLLYLPERVFDVESFLADIARLHKIKPNVVVAVSEGVRTADGRYVGEGAQSGAVDVFGHRYLSGTGKYLTHIIKDRIGCKVRAVELNISQRCAAHFLSRVDIEDSVGIGRAAVDAALSGASGCMMAYIRSASGDDMITYGQTPVEEVANRIRQVPASFINAEGNDVTDACLRYLLPLIQGEMPLICKDGLPVHTVID